jgi:hypothetical protein
VVVLKTDPALPLAKNEMHCKPTYLAEVVIGQNQTHFCQVTVVPESGAVPLEPVRDSKDEDEYVLDHNLSGLKYYVEDAPNGDSIFVFKQKISKLVWFTPWKKNTVQATKTGKTLENWNRGMVSLENHIAQYQEKDSSPVYAVAHFTLPFKCLKKIEEQDILILFDPDDGSVAITFHLWHADQSGRQNVLIKKACKIIKD